MWLQGLTLAILALLSDGEDILRITLRLLWSVSSIWNSSQLILLFLFASNSVNKFLKQFLILMQLAVIGKDGWITLLRYSSLPSLYI